MFTNSSWRQLVALISIAFLLPASLATAQDTTSHLGTVGALHRSELSSATPQAVGDFKIFLPLTQRIIPPLRIDSAASTSYTDTEGNLWEADTGFVDGQIGNLGNISIANTGDPKIYQTERYKLTSYALAVANGNYTVRLHFAENFYTAAGRRVFSVNVEGTPIDNLDIFAEAGAAHIALIKTANVTVADHQLNLDFTASVAETMIDGIEVIPQ